MAGILVARVVAVFADLDTGQTEVGSGYLLDARRVLTARHCTYDKVTGRPATALRVSRASDGAIAVASVQEASSALDVALLVIPGEPPWGSDLPGGPVTFGKVDRERSGQLDDCEAVGYPLWQATGSGAYWDLAELHGYIYALEGRGSERLVLREPRLERVGSSSGSSAVGKAWQGLSGAAVFYDGLLLGIIIEHHPNQGPAAVQVQPIEAVGAIATAAEATASSQAASGTTVDNADTIRLATALALTAPGAFRQVGTAEPHELVAQITAGAGLPTIEACDPFIAGVVRTSHDNAGGARYVARDVDEAELGPALGDNQLIVLLGPSAAGKSRTAIHAARRQLPGYSFLQPQPGVALRSAFGRFSDQQVLVWLDDLDRFIDAGPRGLTMGLLGEIAESRPGWKFLATLRTDRREEIMADEDDRSRVLRQVLGVATVIRLERSLSNAERVRAELAYPDEDFRGGIGLGERLIAGPELRDRLLGAANPLGAMLCRAAIDLQLIGLTPPFSRADLEALAPAYMAHEHPEVSSGTFDFPAAFSWAMAPLVSHVSLLAADSGSPDSVRVADYVAAGVEDLKKKRWIPEPTWTLAIEKADLGELRKTALAAGIAEEWDACASAASKALQASNWDRRFFSYMLGISLHRRRVYPAAMHVLGNAAIAEDESIRAHALEQLADAYYVYGRRDLALQILEVAINTRHVHTVTNAALRIARIQDEQIHSAHGDPVTAQSHYEVAARVAAENSAPLIAGAAWHRIAQLRAEAGDPAGVAEALMEESNYAATSAIRDKIALTAGHQFQDAGDPASARSCYIAVLERTDQPEYVASAAVSIAALDRAPSTAGHPDLEQVAFYYRLAIEKGGGTDAQAAAIHLSSLMLDTGEKRVLLGRAASGSHSKIGAWAELLLAQLELRIGDPSAARPHLDVAFMDLSSTASVETLAELARAMEQTGQAARADLIYATIEHIGNMDERVKAGLDRARLLRSGGRTPQAIAHLRQLIADDDIATWRDDIALELAQALSEAGQRADVITLLEETVGDRTEEVPLLWRHLAVAHFDEGHYAHASKCTRHFVDSPDPGEHAGALWLDGECQLALGDTDMAMQLFAATIETGRLPFAGSAHARLADILADLGGSDEAVLAHCQAAMSTGNPDQAARAAERLAVTLHKLGQTSEGIAALAEFTPKVTPEYRAALLFKWAQLLQQEGKLPSARRKYEEALAAAMDGNQDAMVVTNAADGVLSVIATEDWAERRKVYETMRQHADPDGQARAGFECAQILAGDAQFARAREVLAEVIASDIQPYVDGAWLVLAEVMWQDGDSESTPVALAKVADSDHPWVVKRRPLIEGEVRLGLDDINGAMEWFHRGLASEDPYIAGMSRHWLGLIMSDLGRDAEAIAYLEEAMTSTNHLVAHQATVDLAQHYGEPDPEKAIEIYRSLSKDPIGCLHTRLAALRAGALLTDAGRPDEARPLLKQALFSPQQAVAREAAFHLSVIEGEAGEDEAARGRLARLAEAPHEPHGLAAMHNLAVYDIRDGSFEAALEKFTFIRYRTAPGSYEQALAELGMAEVLIELDRYDEARPALLDLSDSDQPDVRAEAHLLLGHLYRHQGNLIAANQEYHAALAEANLNHDVRRRAQEALDALTA
jgi:tetratricopeptide (TPR) repeat protein